MNHFGTLFRLSIFGESHGNGVGILIDGAPPGISISQDDLLEDLRKRQSGPKGTTPRQEPDIPQILSGVLAGKTTGAPILIMVNNRNTRPADYSSVKDIPRPGHADFVSLKKYFGFSDFRGGGHFSGRLTIGIVAAGVLAKKIIYPMTISAVLTEAAGSTNISREIEKALGSGDSIGGIISCTISHVPVGLGEPFYNSIESVLSHMIFSIPAVRGIEFGAGFVSAAQKGSEHNDPFISPDGRTATNFAGGINGGISNGNDITFRVAVKPTSSISRPQHTINLSTGELTELRIEGRHDVCIALRVPPVLEGAAACVMADLLLQHTGYAAITESLLK